LQDTLAWNRDNVIQSLGKWTTDFFVHLETVVLSQKKELTEVGKLKRIMREMMKPCMPTRQLPRPEPSTPALWHIGELGNKFHWCQSLGTAVDIPYIRVFILLGTPLYAVVIRDMFAEADPPLLASPMPGSHQPGISTMSPNGRRLATRHPCAIRICRRIIFCTRKGSFSKP
jgi:hypothetical protein